MTFYTNVFARGDNIYIREIDETTGVGRQHKVKYSPYLFAKAPKGADTEYKTVNGVPVVKIDFDTMWEAREYTKKYADVQGFDIYGMTDFAYTFINDEFPGTIAYRSDFIRRVSIDIETDSEDGYPDVQTADKEITMITLGFKGVYHVISLKDYVPHKPNIKFYRANGEHHLLRIFLDLITQFSPDLYTGWNIEFFDIPYMIRRIMRELGEDQMKRMSPWGIVNSREIKGAFGKVETIFDLAGVAVIDYLPLYKKYTFTTRDNYKLDTIAQVELGIGKVAMESGVVPHKLVEDGKNKGSCIHVDDNIPKEKLNKMEKIVRIRNLLQKRKESLRRANG